MSQMYVASQEDTKPGLYELRFDNNRKRWYSTFMDTSKIQEDAAEFINDKYDQLQLDLDETYKSASDKLLAAIERVRKTNG